MAGHRQDVDFSATPSMRLSPRVQPKPTAMSIARFCMLDDETLKAHGYYRDALSRRSGGSYML